MYVDWLTCLAVCRARKEHDSVSLVDVGECLTVDLVDGYTTADEGGSIGIRADVESRMEFVKLVEFNCGLLCLR